MGMLAAELAIYNITVSILENMCKHVGYTIQSTGLFYIRAFDRYTHQICFTCVAV